LNAANPFANVSMMAFCTGVPDLVDKIDELNFLEILAAGGRVSTPWI
jgi:hypothetical protein